MAITATAAETLAELNATLMGSDRTGPSSALPNDYTNTIRLIDYLIVQSVAAADLADIDAHFDAVKALLTADMDAKVAAAAINRPQAPY
jgi:hypothetical protein